MDFGSNLIQLRQKAGMSRKELAEKLEIPYTTLRNYETNQREPGHKTLIKLSKIFSTTVDELIGFEPSNHRADASTPTSDESALLATYRRLNADGRQMALAMLESLATNPAYTKDTSSATA